MNQSFEWVAYGTLALAVPVFVLLFFILAAGFLAGPRRPSFTSSFRSSAVTLIQRFGGALNLNMHVITRLVALVPKPRVNLTRFHGVFAPNSKYRALLVFNLAALIFFVANSDSYAVCSNPPCLDPDE